MRTSSAVGLFVAACAVAWVTLGAQQEMRPTPGPGSGKMTVDVATLPAIEAVQRGEWKVTVTNPADLRVPPVDFLRTGARYELTWPGGERETITVAEIGRAGWIRTTGARQRWINTAAARAIDLMP